MEGFIDLWVNYIYQYQKKFLMIKNFMLIVNEYNEKDNSYNEEQKYHIKYVNVVETKINYIKLSVDHNNSIYLFIKTTTEEDCLNWINAIKLQKIKYEKFLDEYYINNRSEKIIPSDGLISDYLEEIKLFMNEVILNNLNDLRINYNLEAVLKVQNSVLNRINNYNNEIERIYYKLNPNNGEEFHLISKSKELKTLFDELKVFY
jgi:hypothetical protein